MPNRPIVIARTIPAAHLILTGYGHWLPNDPRGSGSEELRREELREIGPIHYGRKSVQPPREALRSFYRSAEPRLMHEVFWFDETHRVAMAQAIHDISRRRGYTIWALSILRNHLHAIVRTHSDQVEVMLTRFANATRDAMHLSMSVERTHPVWSDRPYKVYLKTRAQVLTCIRYVEQNPIKEKLGPQRWECVTPCSL